MRTDSSIQPFTQHIIAVLTLSLLTIVSGCGGGGGDESDTLPNVFTFTDVTDANLSAEVTSSITVQGINRPATISVVGGEYSLDGGTTFTSIAGTVNNGQTVSVRQTSSSIPNTETTATLTIGGIDDGFNVTTIADTQVPTAVIQFPTPVSLTEGAMVTVRGTASDDLSSIASVQVSNNGSMFDAVSTDNFATWTAQVDLAPGDNTLQVIVQDASANENRNADTVMIRKGLTTDSFPNTDNPFDVPADLAFDYDNNRVLVVDKDLNAIIGVDLDTGIRSRVSDNTMHGGVTPFDRPRSIVIDGSRALISDTGSLSIIAMDLSDGSRTVFSGAGVPNSDFLITGPRGMVIEGDRVLLADTNSNTILSVDLSTGERSIFSGPSTNFPNYLPWKLTVDADRGRVLVTTVNAVDPVIIIAINLSDGSQSSFIEDNPITGDAFTITFDSLNNRVLTANPDSGSLLAIDPTSADMTALSGGMSNPYIESAAIGVDSVNNRLLVVDFPFLLAVDIVTGERVFFSK